jgi:hypothetical protein
VRPDVIDDASQRNDAARRAHAAQRLRAEMKRTSATPDVERVPFATRSLLGWFGMPDHGDKRMVTMVSKL